MHLPTAGVGNSSSNSRPKYLSKSQESIFVNGNGGDGSLVVAPKSINQNYFVENNDCAQQHHPQGLSLGISIIQGTDNNVYVKDLVENGPGQRNGIHIGDQVSFFLSFTNAFVEYMGRDG